MRVRSLVCLVALLVMAGCGGGKKKLAPGEVPVTVEDFLKPFPQIKVPYIFSDSTLVRRSPDSLRLRVSSWKQLIPDSVYDENFGGQTGLRLYAVGKIQDKERRTYVLVKAISGQGRTGYLFYFDKANKFGGGMRLVEADDDTHTRSYGKLDNRMNVALVMETRKPGGFTAVRESIYGLSDEGGFALVMTNSNEESADRKVYNPIDTLPRRFRLSGDYGAGKNNIVSLRDGVTPREYRFFIHFINEEGETPCKGELKGIAEVTGDNKLKYSDRGGPCGIEFHIDGNELSIREVGGCGAYRDVSCFFEGNYIKKKSPKSKKKK
ncbi:hypothetical protein [Dinghuibacter silviterrae]|uniref:Lipoprotein n=1 Tax=Dinghuibacter silviterrae TaxID=1539049 RepID=A0A4R8DGB0_9BACT|nr:hypothetical protein [Dinghuibacter silviterrae]TDW96284.1 hypothetical protein EDB95_4110 [Dinghuibacter silviterrae]